MARDDLDAAREAIYGIQRQMAAVDDASNEARPATPPDPLWWHLRHSAVAALRITINRKKWK